MRFAPSPWSSTLLPASVFEAAAAAVGGTASSPVLPQPDCDGVLRDEARATAEPDRVGVLVVAEPEFTTAPSMPDRCLILKVATLSEPDLDVKIGINVPIGPELDVLFRDEAPAEPERDVNFRDGVPAESDRDVISEDEAKARVDLAPVPFDKVRLEPLIASSSSDTTTTSR